MPALGETLGYNLRVAGSIAKQVYVAEGLAPPRSFGVVQDAYKTLYERASNPNYWSQIWNNGEWRKVAIYAVEAYGIFTIGEMVSLWDEWIFLRRQCFVSATGSHC